MYNLLIVDDEPLICKGLQGVLKHLGLAIEQVFIAHNGFEALDCIRMEEIDLLITDIQMDGMSGIDLMHHAKMIKPWIETIVISAHEDFNYAKLAIRLGAKDYLIKPLNNDHFLDAVRNVLLKLNKTPPSADDVISKLKEDFVMTKQQPYSTKLLREISTTKMDAMSIANELKRLSELYHIELSGPYFAVIIIQLKLDVGRENERVIMKEDTGLFDYAVLNIVYESLDTQWDHVSFSSAESEVTVIVQWNEDEYRDSDRSKISQLEMFGRSLHADITTILNIRCLMGISQILKGAHYIADLNEQAQKSLRWSAVHEDNDVFYYGDFNWSLYDVEPSKDDLQSQVNGIVHQAQNYIHEHYTQKGLTLNDIAQKNHVSPNYLSYLFKKYTEYNLWEYVIKLRMEESKRLLLNTDLRRYEIAERVGYESPEHFSKIFKRYYGKSLSEMKK